MACHDSPVATQLSIATCAVKGLVVFANRPYAPGDFICRGTPVSITPIRTNTSFQVSEHRFVELDEPARLFSHSCTWNMAVRDNSVGGYDFIASRDIAVGEELTWHYGMTEASSIAVEDCRCGAATCLGRSIGFKEAPRSLQQQLVESGVARYLLEWFAGNAPSKAEE